MLVVLVEEDVEDYPNITCTSEYQQTKVRATPPVSSLKNVSFHGLKLANWAQKRA